MIRDDTHQRRLEAGAACFEMAMRLHSLGLSPLRLCDPQHVSVGRVLENHGKNCTKPGKSPLLAEWKPFQSRQPTLEEITSWWKIYPIGNLGLVLGPAVVRLDVDGEAGHELLLDWSAGDLPATWTFISPGSPHPQYLYGWPQGLPAPRTETKKFDEVHTELKLMGLGFQSVVPPSRHPVGGFYAWVAGCAPGELPLAVAPAWLVERMTPKPRVKGTTRRTLPDGSDGSKRARGLLAEAVRAIETAESGALHDTRWEKSYSIGGLIASGQLPKSAGQVLIDAARGNTSTPDKAEREVEDGLKKGAEKPWTPSDVSGYPLSDSYNADRFCDAYGDALVHCGEQEKFYLYDNGIWLQDDQHRVLNMAREVARLMYVEAGKTRRDIDAKMKSDGVDPTAKDNPYKAEIDAAEAFLRHAVKSNNGGKIREMLNLSRGELAISFTAFDTHIDLLALNNGVVDLRTGTLLEHSRDYYFTKRMRVDFDPSATCHVWERTLLTCLGAPIAPDSPEYSERQIEERYQARERAERLKRFLQCAIGYSLTGDVTEHMLVIMWGLARNGKGTILETLLSLFGELGTKTTQDLFMQSRFEQHPTERADLLGRRLVVTSETDQGRKLNLGFVKEATGGDTQKARRMRQDFFEFAPTHHIFLSTNHKPVIEEDDAIWERIYFVPFERTFLHPARLTDAQQQDPETPVRDMDLKAKLTAELPGILSWAIAGCVSWYANGLYVPNEVIEATAAYRKEEDTLGRFIDEQCTTVSEAKVQPKVLFDRYKAWHTDDDGARLTQRSFRAALIKRGFYQDEIGHKKTRYWMGIGVPTEDDDADKRYR